MSEEICDPEPRCPKCEHLHENGGQCGGCSNEPGNRCLIATSPRTIEKRGPFLREELDILFEAQRTDNVKYLKNWCTAACWFFEAEKRRLLDLIDELELKLRVL